MKNGSAPRRPKRRLDLELVTRGLAPSRERAQALILAGRVRITGREGGKAGTEVTSETPLTVVPDAPWVSRGAMKLLGALDDFGIDCEGRVGLDIGSSTGGFTEVLLSRGARLVYAFDSGRGQMHERIRAHPSVILREGTNARYLTKNDVGEPANVVVMDVSFISLLKIVPQLIPLAAPDADWALLVKPQFEAGRADVGKGGVVRDPKVHLRVLEEVSGALLRLGLPVVAANASRVLGADGNREFFVHARRARKGEGEGRAPIDWTALALGPHA